MHVEERDIARMLLREKLTLNEVKIIMRSARYHRWPDARIDYANTLLPESGDYLPQDTLAALVRADMTEEDARPIVQRNKVFFSRLTTLLPSLVRYFGEEGRSRGIGSLICRLDDCHGDFHIMAKASRKDRELREARKRLANASKLTKEVATALEGAKRHFDIEFDRYRAVYYALPDAGPPRYVDDLIRELRICTGVLEIVDAAANRNAEHLILVGNDKRTTLVEYAYRMCTRWGGPKLVTTPGSDFAALCSLLFEAISGIPDESLAGAINRYARSDDRRRMDQEDREQEENEDDNFPAERTAMWWSGQKIELCEALLRHRGLSAMAQNLLRLRISSEQRKYDVARTTYGPRQVWFGHMNAEQREAERLAAAKSQQFLDSLPARDIELGRKRRADRRPRN